MWNYVLADYRRILKRTPRIIYVAAYEAILLLIMFIAWRKGGAGFDGESLMGSIDLWFIAMGGLLLGFGTLINVYADDFKAKTMQVAIGIGIKRLQVVISKVVQAAMLIITDVLFTAILIVVFSVISGAALGAPQIGRLVIECLMILIRNVCWISIVSILVFKLQGMIMPMVVYVLLSFGILGLLAGIVTGIGPAFMEKIPLREIMPDNVLSTFETSLIDGGFAFFAFIGIVIYIVLGVYITYLLFRKQELDL